MSVGKKGRLIAVLFLAAAGFLWNEPAHAQIQFPDDPAELLPDPVETGCPASRVDTGLRMARAFVSGATFADLRAEAGVSEMPESAVRALAPLGSEADRAVCQTLNERYSELLDRSEPRPFAATYLEAGDFYLVVLNPVSPDDAKENYVTMGLSAIYILDENLDRIFGFSG